MTRELWRLHFEVSNSRHIVSLFENNPWAVQVMICTTEQSAQVDYFNA